MLAQFRILIILLPLALMSCSNDAEEADKIAAKEQAELIEGPKNWKEIKYAIVHRDAKKLRALTPEKINDVRFKQLTERLFQDDVNKAMMGAKFKSLTPIGEGGDEIYAYYFGGTTRRGVYTYKHEVEVYLKMLPDGLCIWNFMLAE